MLNLTEIFDRVGKELEIEMEKLEVGYRLRARVLQAYHKAISKEITKKYDYNEPGKK